MNRESLTRLIICGALTCTFPTSVNRAQEPIMWQISSECVSSHSVCKTILFASLLRLVGWQDFSAVETAHPAHWAYEGKEGPTEWGKLDSNYDSCSSGRTQSPIDIKDAKEADLPALKFGYQSTPLNIVDNGHTIQVNYGPGSTLTIGKNIYALKQFHFHHPAEERINGRDFPMVAHLVHTDARGHLAVVAVLFTLGSANPLIDTLWKNIPREKETPHHIDSISIQVRDLLPKDRSYYTFLGSLTTPPCTEGVSWYVLKGHTTVSPQQVATFASIYPKNARPIQPSNGREILDSK
jgi:carbonic anhydrase